jgi:hypothetical protein
VLLQCVIMPSSTPTGDLLNRARTASDLHMMVQHDGKERDPDEWRAILAEAGFALRRIVPTRSLFSVVEAVPAPAPAPAGSMADGRAVCPAFGDIFSSSGAKEV